MKRFPGSGSRAPRGIRGGIRSGLFPRDRSPEEEATNVPGLSPTPNQAPPAPEPAPAMQPAPVEPPPPVGPPPAPKAAPPVIRPSGAPKTFSKPGTAGALPFRKAQFSAPFTPQPGGSPGSALAEGPVMSVGLGAPVDQERRILDLIESMKR
jgi:hypothetical protein